MSVSITEGSIMKKVILAALLACVSPASAATFCITAQLSTDPAPMQHCETTADANLGYFITAMAASYFPQGVAVTPATNPPTFRAPTPQEILDATGAGLWQGEVANINSYLANQAAAQAVASAPKVQ